MAKYVSITPGKNPNGVSSGQLVTIGIEKDLVSAALRHLDTEVKKKVVKNKRLSKQIAQSLIDAANEAGLTPYKDEYELKKSRQVRGSIDFAKNNYKKRVDILNKLRKIPANNRPAEGSKEDDYHRKTYKRGSINYYQPLRSYLSYPKLRTKPLKDKKGNIIKDEKGAITKVSWGSTEFADRPPHLRDAYKINVDANGKAAITYSVVKPYDDRFKENSNKDYAYRQYFANDADWDRFTEGTTSRWLEVAIGAPVEGNIKIPKYEGANQNYQILVGEVRDVVDDIIRKKMRGK